MLMNLITDFHIDNNLKQSFSHVGLTTYQDFICFTGGQLVSRPTKNPVRKIQVMVGDNYKYFYLKQTSVIRYAKEQKKTVIFQYLNRLVRTILYGHWPHTTAYGEMLAVQYYKKLGIPVMTPVCWGEKRFLGWPLNGFLVVEENEGKNFEIEFNNATLKLRKKLAYGYGGLIGYMHKKEVYDDARCSDVICTSNHFHDFRKSMVTFDRERSRYNKKRVPESRNSKIFSMAKSLSSTFLINAKSGVMKMPSYNELLSFLAGYFFENNMTKAERIELLGHTYNILSNHLNSTQQNEEIAILLNRAKGYD